MEITVITLLLAIFLSLISIIILFNNYLFKVIPEIAIIILPIILLVLLLLFSCFFLFYPIASAALILLITLLYNVYLALFGKKINISPPNTLVVVSSSNSNNNNNNQQQLQPNSPINSIDNQICNSIAIEYAKRKNSNSIDNLVIGFTDDDTKNMDEIKKECISLGAKVESFDSNGNLIDKLISFDNKFKINMLVLDFNDGDDKQQLQDQIEILKIIPLILEKKFKYLNQIVVVSKKPFFLFSYDQQTLLNIIQSIDGLHKLNYQVSLVTPGFLYLSLLDNILFTNNNNNQPLMKYIKYIVDRIGNGDIFISYSTLSYYFYTLIIPMSDFIIDKIKDLFNLKNQENKIK